MYAFGKVIRRLIDEHETSQAEICRATGIKKANLSVICKGKTQYPSISASYAAGCFRAFRASNSSFSCL